MPRIKGSALRGVLYAVKEAGWGIPAFLGGLEPRARAVFEQPILASGWYPYGVYLELLDGYDRRSGLDDHRSMRELGRLLARRDMGLFFKFVTTVASMETMARRCPLFWGQHCDAGTLECTSIDVKARRATAVIRGVTGMRPVHCNLISGWIQEMSAGAGAHGMLVRQIACVADGSPDCRFEGDWQARG